MGTTLHGRTGEVHSYGPEAPITDYGRVDGQEDCQRSDSRLVCRKALLRRDRLHPGHPRIVLCILCRSQKNYNTKCLIGNSIVAGYRTKSNPLLLQQLATIGTVATGATTAARIRDLWYRVAQQRVEQQALELQCLAQQHSGDGSGWVQPNEADDP